MWTRLAFALLIGATPGLAAAAERPAFPAYDIQAFCQTQAKYSYAATLGDSSYDGVFSSCVDRERENKALAQGRWTSVSQKAALECAGLADGRYTYLQRCLDGIRSEHVAR